MITLKVDPALARFLSRGINDALSATTKAAALIGQDRLARYPRASGKKMTFKSDKQRRKFFVMLKSGEVQVPYRRGSSPGSETLGRNFHTQAEGAINHRLTNNASYAPLVLGVDDQADYHKGVWKTDAQVADELRNDGSFFAALDQALSAKLGGL